MSGTQGITKGMEVYGADRQLLGVVDNVQEGGFLVSGQFIPVSAVKQTAGNRIELTDSGAWFKPQGAERGDRAEEDLGPMVGADPSADTKLSVNPRS